MMTMVAQPLTDEDIENLVHFMVSIVPAGPPEPGGNQR
jgi:hypothetical protein